MSRSILIVEDEPYLRQAFITIFKHADYVVYEASDGQKALNFLHTLPSPPNIIILDLLMPVMGGLEFLDVYKLDANFAKTKILVLSNLSDEKTLQNIRDHGAQDFLLKANVSPRELVNAVEVLLKV